MIMENQKELKIEMLLSERGGMIQFRPLGIGHSPEVWEIVTGRSFPYTWSGCCCDMEATIGTIRQITEKLQKLGYSPVFVP